jgi:radical SAM protein with 4Fe4S-binding SPASM domain
VSSYVRRSALPANPLRSRLPSLDIELTERCNNDCIHCCINLAAGDVQARSREMSTDAVKSILQQAAELRCLQVRFTGGEPLLRPDFEELYLFARRLGLKVLIFTNACLLSPRLADLLAHIPPLVPIEVTSYGMNRSSYEAVTRTPGSFDRFRSGIARLMERKIPFVVKGALLPPNRDEVDEFETWAATIPWMAERPGFSMFFERRSHHDDEEKDRLIRSLRVAAPQGLAVLTRDAARYRTEMTEFACKFMRPPGDKLFSCGAGHRVCIDSYGYAQPCLGLRSPDLLKDTSAVSLAAVLDSYASLTELRATNPDYLTRCARCFLHGLCEQCPAKSWAEHATLDTPVEYLCEIAHVQARWLGWLEEGECAWEAKDWKARLTACRLRVGLNAPR